MDCFEKELKYKNNSKKRLEIMTKRINTKYEKIKIKLEEKFKLDEDIFFKTRKKISSLSQQFNNLKNERINKKKNNIIELERLKNENELKNVTGRDENNNLKTVCIYPEQSKVYNPAFDITPKNFVNYLITNKGIVKPNDEEILKLKQD